MRLIALVALLLAGVQDEEAGKVGWIMDYDFGMAKAKMDGRATMIYFHAIDVQACLTLDEKAFSSPQIVAATLRVTPILVECSIPQQNAAIKAKYGIDKAPAVVYTAPDGTVIKKDLGPSASGIAGDIGAVAGKHAKATIWLNSFGTAMALAKKSKKPIAVYLPDPKADLAVFNEKFLKDIGDRKTKFVWLLEAGQPETLGEYLMATAPALLVLDPNAATPKRAPVAKMNPRKDESAENITKFLDDALNPPKK